MRELQRHWHSNSSNLYHIEFKNRLIVYFPWIKLEELKHLKRIYSHTGVALTQRKPHSLGSPITHLFKSYTGKREIPDNKLVSIGYKVLAYLKYHMSNSRFKKFPTQRRFVTHPRHFISSSVDFYLPWITCHISKSNSII